MRCGDLLDYSANSTSILTIRLNGTALVSNGLIGNFLRKGSFENSRSEDAHLSPLVRALFSKVTLVRPYNEDLFAAGGRSVRSSSCEHS